MDEGQDVFVSLPTELLLSIWVYLRLQEVFCLSFVCVRWRQILEESSVWAGLHKRLVFILSNIDTAVLLTCAKLFWWKGEIISRKDMEAINGAEL